MLVLVPFMVFHKIRYIMSNMITVLRWKFHCLIITESYDNSNTFMILFHGYKSTTNLNPHINYKSWYTKLLGFDLILALIHDELCMCRGQVIHIYLKVSTFRILKRY